MVESIAELCWACEAGGMGYRASMRTVPAIFALVLLAACSKESAAPQGNEQAVIDKANADVAAAEAAASGQ